MNETITAVAACTKAAVCRVNKAWKELGDSLFTCSGQELVIGAALCVTAGILLGKACGKKKCRCQCEETSPDEEEEI